MSANMANKVQPAKGVPEKGLLAQPEISRKVSWMRLLSYPWRILKFG